MREEGELSLRHGDREVFFGSGQPKGTRIGFPPQLTVTGGHLMCPGREPLGLLGSVVEMRYEGRRWLYVIRWYDTGADSFSLEWPD